MSQEIIEAVREIERDKGIEEGALVAALEDALLAAYKKTPGASRHATVEMDDDGDFRVFSIELPADVEERLLDDARERKLEELERLEEETGERQHTLISDDDLDIDWSDIPEDQIKREDVTPEGFGRIAAQTAKQVILQRIREEERRMMYDEYIDRVGEVVTGIVQQAGDRNNVLVDLGKVESLLPRSEQVDGERYEQGSRIKAVITEVRSGTKGPQVDPVAPRSRADQDAVRARGAGDRRRSRRDPRRRARAGLPLEDRRRVARPGRRPGRRVRRPARLARAHGRLRAARREDRHHPVEQRARALRREGAVARPRPRGLPRRRRQGGDGRRPRRPARARDRQGGHERPPRRAPHRLEDRHPERHRVRAGRGGDRLRRRRRRGRGHLRPLLRDPLERQALPERVAARLEVLRRARAPGARAARHGRRGARRHRVGAGARGARRPAAARRRVGRPVAAGARGDRGRLAAPADVAATHGPTATAIAEAEGEVDLDTVTPEIAPPPEVPAGIPVEHEETHEEA